MSKQETPDGPAPKVYDAEKIIDIHSSEWDPSLDSKKVREVKSYAPHLKYTNTFSNEDSKDDSNAIKKTPIQSKHSNTSKDVDVYDYRGELH